MPSEHNNAVELGPVGVTIMRIGLAAYRCSRISGVGWQVVAQRSAAEVMSGHLSSDHGSRALAEVVAYDAEHSSSGGGWSPISTCSLPLRDTACIGGGRLNCASWSA